MKRIKRAGALFLALALALSLSGCISLKPQGGGTEPETKPEQSAAGAYSLFAIELDGDLAENAAFDMTSDLTLEKDGGGYMSINNAGGEVSSWSQDGKRVSVTSGVATMNGIFYDGILTLELEDEMVLYYAAEGVDTSEFPVMTKEEFIAAGGAAKVLLNMGKEYYYGTGTEGYDLDKAKEAFTKAAEQGNADAWYYLGKIAEYSIEKNHAKTMLADFEKAAELGSPLGLYGQGRAYMLGKGVAADYANAQRFFQQAVALDCKEANKGLGDLYMFGYGVDTDAQQALTLYTAATEGKDFGIVHSAGLSIGDLYYYGRLDLEPDYAKALEYYQKAIDDGFAEGLVSLAFAYEEGNGVVQDMAAAKEYFEKAAALGEPAAMSELGNLYYTGNAGEKDFASALSWYEKAGTYADGNACLIAGEMYQYGEGTNADAQKAIDWYLKAAQEGVTDAYSRIGDIYHFDEFENKDEAKALKYYKKADKAGDSYGTARAGSFYYWGYDVDINYKKAVKYFKRAAKRKDATGQYYLGTAYYQGHGLKQNYKKAANFFRKAAKNGEACGQMWTGYMYMKGLGVKKNLKTAKKWMNKSLKSGKLNKADRKQVKKWLKAMKKSSKKK